MDWNILLFIGKWGMIGLFYTVLITLLLGVYRESAQRVERVSSPSTLFYGRLRLVNPGGDLSLRAGKVFDLKLETTLGSEDDNDIVLKDPFVSRKHARLQWDGAVWWLEDLGSKNGTLLNNLPLQPHRPQMVQPHAAISIGDIVFELLE